MFRRFTIAVALLSIIACIPKSYGQATVALTPETEKSITDLFERLSDDSFTVDRFKYECLLRSENQLRIVLRALKLQSNRLPYELESCLAKPIELQVEPLEALLQLSEYEVSSLLGGFQIKNDLCRRLQLIAWNTRDWEPSATATHIDNLKKSIASYRASPNHQSWAELVDLIDLLQNTPATSELADRVARECVFPNVVVSLPPRPLENAMSRSFQYPIHLEQQAGEYRIRANGSLLVDFDICLHESSGFARCNLNLHGRGDSSVIARSNRVAVAANLHTQLDGSIVIPFTDRKKESVSVQADNKLTLCGADYQSCVPVFNRLADNRTRRVTLKKLPLLEQESEWKIKENLTRAISDSLRNGLAKAQSSYSDDLKQRIIEFGTTGQALSPKIDRAANFPIAIISALGAPKISTFSFDDTPLQDQMVIRIGQGLFTQLMDTQRGCWVRETELRERLFHSLGQAPVFEQDLSATAPRSFQLDYRRPLQMAFREGSVDLTLACIGFDDGVSLPVPGKFVVKTSYQAEFRGNQMFLHRVGLPKVNGTADRDATRIESFVDRFFPPITEPTEVTLVDEVASVLGLSLERFEFQPGWLAAKFRYDPTALAQRAIQQITAKP
jgi:hypothetical protein